MEKGDISVLNQLLLSMQEAVNKLEEAMNKNDITQINYAKRAILSFQKEVDKIR